MLKKFAAWVEAFAVTLGAPGLFIISFLDSSFLSLPEVTDLLLVVMVTQHPVRMTIYATMATAGSVAGCYAIYYLARRGGEAWVRKRFHERHVDRSLELFQRYGIWALIVPAVLPPPAPFKIFVLMAGVAGMSTPRFLLGVTAGRGLRYFGEALLALWYGKAALTFLNDNLKPVAWLTLGLMALGIVYLIWRWKRRKV